MAAVTAVTNTISRRPAHDAIALLENDHRRMEALLERGEKTTARGARGRTRLLEMISSELSGHEKIEEKVFYPGLRRHPEARDIVNEGFEEHHVADLVLEELHRSAADSEQWTARFKVLKETVEHHIEEEEGEMFRTARAVLTPAQLEAMGRRMAAMRAQAKRARTH